MATLVLDVPALIADEFVTSQVVLYDVAIYLLVWPSIWRISGGTSLLMGYRNLAFSVRESGFVRITGKTCNENSASCC